MTAFPGPTDTDANDSTTENTGTSTSRGVDRNAPVEGEIRGPQPAHRYCGDQKCSKEMAAHASSTLAHHVIRDSRVGTVIAVRLPEPIDKYYIRIGAHGLPILTPPLPQRLRVRCHGHFDHGRPQQSFLVEIATLELFDNLMVAVPGCLDISARCCSPAS